MDTVMFDGLNYIKIFMDCGARIEQHKKNIIDRTERTNSRTLHLTNCSYSCVQVQCSKDLIKAKICVIHHLNVQIVLHCTNSIDENRKSFLIEFADWKLAALLNWNWTKFNSNSRDFHFSFESKECVLIQFIPPRFPRKNPQITLFISCISNYINRGRRSSNKSWVCCA